MNPEDGIERLVPIPANEFRMVRISPFDICFNPTASSFEKTPKIIRSIKTLGELKRMADTDKNIEAAFNRLMRGRAAVRGSDATFAKADGYIADGFTSIQQYYESFRKHFYANR